MKFERRLSVEENEYEDVIRVSEQRNNSVLIELESGFYTTLTIRRSQVLILKSLLTEFCKELGITDESRPF